MNTKQIKQIPLTEVTAYLAGVIIGDGHISNSTKSKTDKSLDYRITIELSEENFLTEIASLTKNIIQTKSKVIKRKLREDKSQHYYFQFRNKSFYYFLTTDLGIPFGKKSNFVKIPTKIRNCFDLQWPFLAGLFDTDGGIRGKTVGFTSSSIDLMKDVSNLLNVLGIAHSNEFWINKKYCRAFYGIRIKKNSTDTFLNNLPMRNYEKRKRVFYHVDVPERSNGMVNL